MAPRFFIPFEITPARVGQTLELPREVAHHAVRVLRLATGDALTLFDGTGGEYAGTIARADKQGIQVRIEGRITIDRESPLAITLAQAVVAADAMDYAIRKATELGAARIQPLITARSAPLPAGERSDKRHARWRQVAIAACEQCGRNRIPDIVDAQTLADWMAAWRGTVIMLVPDAQEGMAMLERPKAPVALLVGPEGGWTSEEITAARRARSSVVRLGPRILRADTAGTAALAAMQMLWGDFETR